MKEYLRVQSETGVEMTYDVSSFWCQFLPMILDVIVSPSREALRDLRPPVPQILVGFSQQAFLFFRPRSFVDRRI